MRTKGLRSVSYGSAPFSGMRRCKMGGSSARYPPAKARTPTTNPAIGLRIEALPMMRAKGSGSVVFAPGFE